MRMLRVTIFAAAIAALAVLPVIHAERLSVARRLYQFPMDHQSGGLAVSATRFYTGTDTGTMEERTHDGHLLNVRNTFDATSGPFTFNNETNRLGSFSQITENGVFYFCSQDDNAVYRYNTATDVMTRMAGNGQPGLLAGTGTAARMDCQMTAVTSAVNQVGTLPHSMLYMFSGKSGSSNFAIISVALAAGTAQDAGLLAVVAGSGTEGHNDAIGSLAQIGAGSAMSYYKESGAAYLILAFANDNQGPIRHINLGTNAVGTAGIQYDTTAHTRGVNGAARVPHVLGLSGLTANRFAFGVTEASRVFTLAWNADLSTFRIEFSDVALSGKWGTATEPNGARIFFGNNVPGNGTIARFNVNPATKTITPPPTKTRTSTITPPSRTQERTPTVPLTTTTTAAPTTRAATPVPTNAPGAGMTTLAPGETTNTTIDAATGASVFVASGMAAALLAILC